MKKREDTVRSAQHAECVVALETRTTTRSLLAGLFILTLSVAIIVIQNRNDLLSLFLEKRITFEDVFPMLTFLYACGHVWYYTCRAARINRKRLQLWIGNVRAVVLVGFFLILINYL